MVVKQIIFFANEKGKTPFWDFFQKLDKTYKIIIQKRLKRIEETGYFGNIKNLKDGIWEMKFDNGIRIYYGEDENIIVIVLTGSLKDNQQKAIEEAKKYWKEYKKLRGVK